MALPAAAAEVPFWAPRAALAGATFHGGAAVAQLRVAWELPFLTQKYDQMAFVVEGGGGYGLPALPALMTFDGERRLTFLYQYMVTAGIGYGTTRPSGFHFGVLLTSGLLFYGARFDRGPKENPLAGTLEGRVEVGYRAGGVVYSLAAGYSAPYERPRGSDAFEAIGGPLLALTASWR